MPNFTPNLDLIKPLGIENFSVSHANSNADKVDAAFGDVSVQLGQTEQQVTQLQIEKADKSEVDSLATNKADKTELQATDAIARDAQTKANDPLVRIVNNSIPSSKLKQTTDADKIKLDNLSLEVRNAITGSTSMGTTPAPGSVVVESIANEAVTFTKLAKQALDIKFIPSDSIPDYNQATKTFNFNSAQYYEAVLVYGDNFYTIPANTVVVNTLTSSAIKLIFNTVSKAFSFVSYAAIISADEIVLAVIRDRNQWICHVSSVFDLTINGFTVGDIMNNNLLKPVHLIVGGKNYPVIDSVNKTLTFPSNFYSSFVIVGGRVYSDAIPSSGLVIDLSLATGTTAWCVLFRISTKTFELVAWNQIESYAKTHALFATFRIVGNDYCFNMPCHYIKDGKLFGEVPLNEDSLVQRVEDLETTVQNLVGGVVENRLDAFVKAIAHRGYSTEAPENTLPAYVLAKKKGFSYVECDVEWTSDLVPVLLHDQTINRTSNGTGNINYMTFEAARAYDFGSWKAPEYAGTKIPSFEEFIILCKKLSLHPYIELKGGINAQKAQILVDIVKKAGMVKNVTWVSFASTYLDTLLTVFPTAHVGLLGTMTQALINKAILMKTSQNDVFIDADNYLLDEALVESALMEGIDVEVWTVNNEARVHELASMGIGGITTDTLNIAEVLQQ